MTMEFKPDIQLDETFYKVQEVRKLTEEAFSIRLPRSRFKYHAGQHVSLGIHGDYQSREYSIYSGENDECLEVLVKEVKDGYFSPKLSKLKVGDLVEVSGPFGKFRIDEKKIADHKFVFIASGTGIAPFRSMVRTHPQLDYTLIHGVRYGSEAYDKQEYAADRHILCTSGDRSGQVHGRLTTYLADATFEKNTQFYLCGNSNMIFDAIEILKNKGFDRDQIHCEVYF
ncbi:ferredoxin--NADP reductase [Mangrovibacterium marinum]|uniref:Ferredoxin--NADP+ reductase/benzoate/toluate 1,2-dioxygenase reductase subunit n=1 Tax=Mangrovibacterium marinum TaxID=1639118 RepID=A0A2T5C1V6_9BACT|nr:FAD-binding oxidoreductase [Mangrovibacterium marinum]PTN08679.1 ferredoxin--NADP+ reductase/benzoate/toluate 1,2-dioxygenase reductase subunit [Mangrovibacterium marinum]